MDATRGQLMGPDWRCACASFAALCVLAMVLDACGNGIDRDARDARVTRDQSAYLDAPARADGRAEASQVADRSVSDASAVGEASSGGDAGPVPGAIGSPCVEEGTDVCELEGGLCVTAKRDGKPRGRWCSRRCTPDDTATGELDEDDCPAGSRCVFFEPGWICAQTCTLSAERPGCAARFLSCDPSTVNLRPYGQVVCLHAGCAADRECSLLGLASDLCSTDNQCKTRLGAADAFCQGVRCARPGRCLPSGLCGVHDKGSPTARIGDPCETDFQCPSAAFCLPEVDRSGKETGHRNGYCTSVGCAYANLLPFKECPAGATCSTLDTFDGECLRICDPGAAASCRGHAQDKAGDYECYDATRARHNGLPVASWPFCAPPVRCSRSSSCANLAPVLNPQKMRCVDPETGSDLPERSPTGVCRDDTSSGPP